MLDIVAPYLGGILIGFFQSHRILKKHIFIISFLLFTMLFGTYITIFPPERGIYMGWMFAKDFGVFVGVVLTILIWLCEISLRREQQNPSKRYTVGNGEP